MNIQYCINKPPIPTEAGWICHQQIEFLKLGHKSIYFMRKDHRNNNTAYQI